jgi:hypothetical protein
MRWVTASLPQGPEQKKWGGKLPDLTNERGAATMDDAESKQWHARIV